MSIQGIMRLVRGRTVGGEKKRENSGRKNTVAVARLSALECVVYGEEEESV